MNVRLVGNVEAPRDLRFGDTWVEPMIGVRMRHAVDEDWILNDPAGSGAFGVNVAPQGAWPACAATGHRFDDRWAVWRGSSRALTAQRVDGRRDVAPRLSGPATSLRVSS